jgi:hypothetical protein
MPKAKKKEIVCFSLLPPGKNDPPARPVLFFAFVFILYRVSVKDRSEK